MSVLVDRAASGQGPKLARRVGPRVVSREGELVIVGIDGRAQVMEGATAGVARLLLDELASPRTRAVLREIVASASGQEVAEGGVVDQILDALIGFGVLGDADRFVERPLHRVRPIGPRPRVVLGLTGAIHSIQAPTMIQALQARSMDVRVVVSRSASRLVRAVGLEALTHHPVSTSMWSRDPHRPVPHLDLAEWADVVVVCPASATTIARLARGDFGDLVAAVALSTAAAVIVAPSMNEAMLDSPSVQRNLAQLERDGFWVIEPSEGVEVADAPDRRRAHRGTAPRADVLADVVSMVIGRVRAQAHSADPASMPRDAAAWEALWGGGGVRAWEEDALDEAVIGQLCGLLARPSRVLDLGTGSGLVAAALARAGHRVVATDVSRSALDRARLATVGLDVTLVADDACASSLMGPFDLAIDRACLHALPTDRHASYAATLARILPPGGRLALVVDAPDAPAERATHRFAEADLRALFGESFDVGPATAATLRHLGAPSPARAFVLRRKG